MKLRTIQTLFAITVIILLASSLAQRYLGHTLENPNLDFHDYYFAAQTLHPHPQSPLYEGALDGNPQLKTAPYSSSIAQRARAAGLSETELYLYPPQLADLLVPMTLLPLERASLLWRLFNLALVLLCAIALASSLGIRLLSFELVTLAVLAYAFWPVHEAISLGQVAILMLALWTVGVTAYFNERPALSAVALAFATTLKVTPILILPLFFLWRDKRWLTWYLSSLVILLLGMLLLNGQQNLITYVHVMQAMGGSVPAMQNKCIGSLLAWAYYGKLFTTASVHAVLDTPNPVLSLASKVASLSFYALCLVLVWRRRGGHPATTLAVFALVTALISPVSWRHGYTVALIPLAFLWTSALRHGATRLRTILLTLTTLTLGSLVFDLAAQLPLPMPLKVIFASTWIIFSLLLCVEVLWSPPLTRSFPQGIADKS